MQVINWLELQPLPANLAALNERLREALPLRNLCQLLVETILRAYPWTRRADLISCYHPSQTYKQGQRIALFIPDSQNVHRIIWLLAQVSGARIVENPIQGRFQVLTLDTHGRHIQMAGGIPDASYPEPDLSAYTAEDLAWFVEWVSDTYAAPLQATVRKLIQKGQIRGELAGTIFLPAQASALSADLLHPFFARISAARPWISLEEILRGMPDLSQVERETALGLIRTSLKESPYRSLGADRWTTPELFDQLNRDVPRGLSTLHVRSKVPAWTKQDKQDLAGYGRKFMPTAAWRALEELEAGERLPEANASPWRPPKAPLRLPTLNYLHITQAYFPVGSILPAFAPDVQMVFLQFINGDHQPFLLDRENGLLKALHPEAMRSKILKDGIPAGTYLWLEYEGGEKYRIAPQRLPFKRLVPCKLAQLESGRLHVQPIQISMGYEGDSALFKADMRSEEIEALFAEASRVKLSLRDAIIYAMQDICGTDLSHRAHWLDLLNAVFLKRMCSPSSVLFLLYTQPCFASLGGGYFRYQQTPNVTVRKIRKRTDRLSQLWDGLLSNPVAPEPLAKARTTFRARLEVGYPVPVRFSPELKLPSLLKESETEAEISVTALWSSAMEEKERTESVMLNNYEPDSFRRTRREAAMLVNEDEREDPEGLSYNQGELENAEPSALSTEEAESEREESADVPFEDARTEFSFFSPTLGLEPRPDWVNRPIKPNHPSPTAADARRFVYRPRIPLRPFHKQPLYRRVFFYLRGWLSRIFGKTG